MKFYYIFLIFAITTTINCSKVGKKTTRFTTKSSCSNHDCDNLRQCVLVKGDTEPTCRCQIGLKEKECFLKSISNKQSCSECNMITNCLANKNSKECQCHKDEKIDKCYMEAKTKIKKVRNSKKNKKDENNKPKKPNAKTIKIHKQVEGTLLKSASGSTKLPKVDRLTKRTTTSSTTLKI